MNITISESVGLNEEAWKATKYGHVNYLRLLKKAGHNLRQADIWYRTSVYWAAYVCSRKANETLIIKIDFFRVLNSQTYQYFCNEQS